jgi:hypothetical protein
MREAYGRALATRNPVACNARMRSAVAGYLVLESAAIVAWWALILAFPAWQRHFLALDAPRSTLLAFLAADLVLVALGFLVAALLAARRASAWPLLCVRAGAAAYAALYAIALPVVGDGGELGAAMMVPVLIASPVAAILLRPRGSSAA